MNAPFRTAQNFDTRDAASEYMARRIAGVIEDAVDARGSAMILLSGGSTPKQAYSLLSGFDLPWENVKIGLVDDRCVPESNPGSNQAMIKAAFSSGPSAKAAIIDMVNLNPDGHAELGSANQRMTEEIAHVDYCLMGMGTDGHTASWFPGSSGLKQALDINTPDSVALINASGSAVAGDYPNRITLTLPVIMRAQHLDLFITGEEKAQVFTNARSKSVYAAPVKALLAAGSRLTTIWAP